MNVCVVIVISAFEMKYSCIGKLYKTMNIHGKSIFMSPNMDLNVYVDFDNVEDLFLLTPYPNDYELLEMYDDNDKTYIIYGNDKYKEHLDPIDLLTTIAYGDVIIICLQNDKIIDFYFNDFFRNYTRALEDELKIKIDLKKEQLDKKLRNMKGMPIKYKLNKLG